MNKGFTLIELLIVVLIVGILSAVALPQYTASVERSRAAEALQLMGALGQSLERYRAQKDAWPSNGDFSLLDMEMPTTKYFAITFTSSGASATITATRNITHGYELFAVVTDTESGAFTTVRSCKPKEGDSDAAGYCNAITGGKNDNF